MQISLTIGPYAYRFAMSHPPTDDERALLDARLIELAEAHNGLTAAMAIAAISAWHRLIVSGADPRRIAMLRHASQMNRAANAARREASARAHPFGSVRVGRTWWVYRRVPAGVAWWPVRRM